jgi:hypothetical protein
MRDRDDVVGAFFISLSKAEQGYHFPQKNKGGQCLDRPLNRVAADSIRIR